MTPLFWFYPASFTQFRDPALYLAGYNVVRTPNLEHQKRTLYPLRQPHIDKMAPRNGFLLHSSWLRLGT